MCTPELYNHAASPSSPAIPFQPIYASAPLGDRMPPITRKRHASVYAVYRHFAEHPELPQPSADELRRHVLRISSLALTRAHGLLMSRGLITVNPRARVGRIIVHPVTDAHCRTLQPRRGVAR